MRHFPDTGAKTQKWNDLSKVTPLECLSHPFRVAFLTVNGPLYILIMPVGQNHHSFLPTSLKWLNGKGPLGKLMLFLWKTQRVRQVGRRDNDSDVWIIPGLNQEVIDKLWFREERGWTKGRQGCLEARKKKTTEFYTQSDRQGAKHTFHNLHHLICTTTLWDRLSALYK